MRNIQNIAGFVFISSVWILCIVSILGVWSVLSNDVIYKSFETLGILAFVAAVVMVAGKFINVNSQSVDAGLVVLPNPAFKSIRKTTLVILIISVSFLAFLGILSIWGVIKDQDVLSKTFGTLLTLAFSSFLVVVTCLNREGGLKK